MRVLMRRRLSVALLLASSALAGGARADEPAAAPVPGPVPPSPPPSTGAAAAPVAPPTVERAQPASAPSSPSEESPGGAEPAEEPSRVLTGELGTKRDSWKMSLGFRVASVGDSTFDAFAKGDALAGVTLAASRTLFGRDRFALAAGLAWDHGGRGSSMRGLAAGLTSERFALPIEARFHPRPLVYGFARVAPGAQLLRFDVTDPSAPSQLRGSAWSFATDLSLGASLLLGPHAAPTRHRARFWLTPEVGVQLATAANLKLEPTDRDDPRPVASTKLGALSTNGVFFRMTLDLSL